MRPMRLPWLFFTMLFTLNACSGAVFKGKTGGSSKNDSPSSEDGTVANPPVPPIETPKTDGPIVPDPAQKPCDEIALYRLSSLYQLHDEECHKPGDGDGDDDDGDDDDGDENENPPGDNDPGQS